MLRETERAAMLAHLVALCDAAADQVALAHQSLHHSPEKAEAAIAHMDAALDCLRQCTLQR